MSYLLLKIYILYDTIQINKKEGTMYKIFSLNNKLKQYLTIDLDKLYILLNTSSKGLKSNQILLQRKNFGDNNFNILSA